MKTEDLSKVKYIGASRLKSLNDLGITTVKQLYETPLNKLSKISTIGKYYAKLIKAEASKAYQEKPGEIVSKIVSGKEKKIEEFKQDLDKKIKVLKTSLKQASEDLKTLGKKKLNSDFKKRSKTLMNRLDGLDKIKGDLSSKISKNIIKKADALNETLKNVVKKPKSKKYKKLSRTIQSFSKMLKKTGS
jgi:exonuclease VII large subunit